MSAITRLSQAPLKRVLVDRDVGLIALVSTICTSLSSSPPSTYVRHYEIITGAPLKRVHVDRDIGLVVLVVTVYALYNKDLQEHH